MLSHARNARRVNLAQAVRQALSLEVNDVVIGRQHPSLPGVIQSYNATYGDHSLKLRRPGFLYSVALLGAEGSVFSWGGGANFTTGSDSGVTLG